MTVFPSQKPLTIEALMPELQVFPPSVGTSDTQRVYTPTASRWLAAGHPLTSWPAACQEAGNLFRKRTLVALGGGEGYGYLGNWSTL